MRARERVERGVCETEPPDRKRGSASHQANVLTGLATTYCTYTLFLSLASLSCHTLATTKATRPLPPLDSQCAREWTVLAGQIPWRIS